MGKTFRNPNIHTHRSSEAKDFILHGLDTSRVGVGCAKQDNGLGVVYGHFAMGLRGENFLREVIGIADFLVKVNNENNKHAIEGKNVQFITIFK